MLEGYCPKCGLGLQTSDIDDQTSQIVYSCDIKIFCESCKEYFLLSELEEISEADYFGE